MQVAIIGVGGVGAVLGARLIDAGHETVFVARGAQLRAITERGITVEQAEGRLAVGPVRASADANDFKPVELVVLCVKAWQVADVCEGVRPLLDDRTAVLTLQNGIDAPEIVASRLGAHHAMPGLIRIISYLIEPGLVRDDGFSPQIMFGELDGSASERTEAVIEAMSSAGIEAMVPEDLAREMWRKLLFIASTSAVGAATRVSFGSFLAQGHARTVLRECQLEIARVARAAGVDLPDSVVEQTMAFTDGLPAETTASMQRDIMASRPSELFDQTGAVVRIASQLGVDVPVNQALLGVLEPQERVARAEMG